MDDIQPTRGFLNRPLRIWALHFAILSTVLIMVWVPLWLGYSPDGYRPRQPSSLGNIFVGPIGHGDALHAFINALFVCFFSEVVLLANFVEWLVAFVGGWIIGGLSVWCLGVDHEHVGLNGVAFSLLGWITVAGLWQRQGYRLHVVALTILLGMGYFLILQRVFIDDARFSWKDDIVSLSTGCLLSAIWGLFLKTALAQKYCRSQYRRMESTQHHPVSTIIMEITDKPLGREDGIGEDFDSDADGEDGTNDNPKRNQKGQRKSVDDFDTASVSTAAHVIGVSSSGGTFSPTSPPPVSREALDEGMQRKDSDDLWGSRKFEV